MAGRFILAVLATWVIITMPASSATMWYAKWNGTPPITVKVSGISDFPVADQAMIRTAMADWSASPSVEYIEGNGMVKIEICDGCGFLTRPKDNRGVLHGVTIQIDRQWLGNEWMQGIYCHEFGHGLGLHETPCPNSQHPTQEDFDTLTKMYPVR
jgi:hypothetical protein